MSDITQNCKYNQDIKLKNSMNQKYVSKCIFPCLQETRMRRSKKEEQKIDVRSDKKEDTMVEEKKIHCSF